MICRQKSQARRGIAIPLIALCIIGLFAFVALAVDLGMLAISRTHAQNAADIAALAGTRQLSNRPGVVNSNLAQAVKTARDAATSNFHRNAQFTLGQIERIDVGQYLYDPISQQFRVTTWYNAAENPTPPSGSWTALRVRMTAPQSTYFMRILGVNTMTTYAIATAVYRPRDIAFVLDMTGSMQYGSLFNYNSRSHNPDTLIPRFGHYSNSTIQSRLISTTNYSSGAYTYARNNFTIYTPGGPQSFVTFTLTRPISAILRHRQWQSIRQISAMLSIVGILQKAAPIPIPTPRRPTTSPVTTPLTLPTLVVPPLLRTTSST